MSSGSGGGGSTTSTQQFKPPDYTQPAWTDFLTGAQGLTSQPMNTYTGMQVAPMTTDQTQAGQMTQDTALYGSPDVNTGRGAATQVAGGQFFNNSPWTDPSYVNNVINQNAGVMANAAAVGQNAQTDASAAMQGAYGGSAYDQAQGRNALALNTAVGNMANQYQLGNAQMGNQNYMTGVNQMLQGAQLGEQGQALDLQAAGALNQTGSQQQQYLQNLLNSQYGTFQQQQAFPYTNLSAMLNALSGASGNYGTTTYNPYASSSMNPVTGLLGGAGLGLGAYQALSGG